MMNSRFKLPSKREAAKTPMKNDCSRRVPSPQEAAFPAMLEVLPPPASPAVRHPAVSLQTVITAAVPQLLPLRGTGAEGVGKQPFIW